MLLVYRLPREPSRHRVAVWRKLRDLGAIYLKDGVAALPEDAVTREQLEWLQLRVREAGGEATLWEARPGTVAEEAELVEAFRSSREEAYKAIIARAQRLRRKAQNILEAYLGAQFTGKPHGIAQCVGDLGLAATGRHAVGEVLGVVGHHVVDLGWRQPGEAAVQGV